ncbi:MAG: hypothetical protein HZC28_06225 [Spirochaetes bacterium]|nr:hypothetical protein [Spirochaetota bacterium]
MRIFLPFVLLAAFLVAADIHVAPGGDDGNSGTKDKPFASITRAQTAARAERKRSPGDTVTVWLAGGMYHLAEKLSMSAEDSGASGAPTVYRALPDARAIISGGRKITGTWKKTAGKNFYELNVPDVLSKRWFFNSLYVNSVSKTRARKPNENEKMMRAKGRAQGEQSNKAFVYFSGDIDPQWKNLTDIDIIQINSWTPTMHRITAADAAKRVVKFESTHGRPVDFWEKNFRYYVANVFEALDYPGEWYLDRVTGTLYYYPEPGEDMSRADVIAPVLMTRIMEIVSADYGTPAQYLEFRDITFAHVDGDLDKHNGVYRQGHMYLSAGIYAKNMRQSMFSNCEIAHLGEYAMELDTGCQSNTVVHCHIWDMGSGGIQIGITDLKTLQTLEKTAPKEQIRVLHNTIDNNILHRLGTIWHGCYGIINRFCSYTRITHNDIFDVHWDPISSDARWTYNGEDYSGGHEVAYNYLHYLGLGYQGDAAGYYQFGPLDTHVHHNITCDTVAYPFIHAGFAGYYLDEMSRGALVENNLAYNVDWSAYFQNWGSNNTFRNNIGAFARDGFITRGGLGKTGRNHFAASNNIYIGSNRIAIGRKMESGSMPPEISRNCYWNTAGDRDMTFMNLSFDDYQKLGYDRDSIIEDPLFRDPNRFDFTVDPSSPAVTKAGFVPFDDEIKKAGLYGDDEWRSLPKKFAVRPRIPVDNGFDLSKLSRVDLDFESMAVGTEPNEFTIRKEKDATFAVTEDAAFSGKRSLKCTDRKDISKSYNPHAFAQFKNIESGRFRMSFAAMISASQPVNFRVEVRGKGFVDETGPQIDFNPDGTVMAGKNKIADIRPGTWVVAAITFVINGDNAAYDLLLKYDGTEIKKSLPFVHAHFKSVTWAGITANSQADGEIFFDDMFIGVE